MPSQDNEAALLKKIAKGDARSFEKLYDLFAAPLYGLVLQLCDDKSKTSEIFEQSFIQLWHSTPNYSSEKSSGFAWITSTFRKLALHQIRSAGLKPAASSAPVDQKAFFSTTPATTVAEEEHEVNYHEHAALLRNSLQLLSPAQRSYIEYALLTNETTEAIAHRYSADLQEVKIQIRKGLQRLRDLIKEGEGE